MRLELMPPFVQERLLIGFESLIRDFEHRTVLGQIQRNDVRLTLARTVTKDIQGNGDQPLTKIQDAGLAFEGIVGAEESFLNDVFSIVWTTCQAQGKEIESLLVNLNEPPKMAVQVAGQQREQFLIALIHIFPSPLFSLFNTKGHKKGRKGCKVEPLAPGSLSLNPIPVGARVVRSGREGRNRRPLRLPRSFHALVNVCSFDCKFV